jgi:hypothetical protein
MPTVTLDAWRNLLIRASFERPALEESLIDAILSDSSLSDMERRNIQHDLHFSFFRTGVDEEMAENDLGEVINILLFEQEFCPKLERLSTALYARGGDAEINEAEWLEHLELIAIKRRNDERLNDLKANIEEQLLAA